MLDSKYKSLSRVLPCQGSGDTENSGTESASRSFCADAIGHLSSVARESGTDGHHLTARDFHRIFSPREPDWSEAEHLALLFSAGLFTVAHCTLPVRPYEEARRLLTRDLWLGFGTGNESRQHRHLKLSVYEWMVGQGCADIKFERSCPYGRADVSSGRPEFFAEVGNTDMNRATRGIFVENAALLVVPYPDPLEEAKTLRGFLFRTTELGLRYAVKMERECLRSTRERMEAYFESIRSEDAALPSGEAL